MKNDILRNILRILISILKAFFRNEKKQNERNSENSINKLVLEIIIKRKEADIEKEILKQEPNKEFLVCPIFKNDDFGNPLTHRTVKISAVIDHSETAIDQTSNRLWGVHAKDQKVKAFNGEIGEGTKCPQEPCGYSKNDNCEFFKNKEINYVGVLSDGGKKILQYDGHAGYDFPYPLLTPIIAPANGYLSKAAQGTDLIYGANWNKDHSFYIKHDNGFITWFRHSNKLVDEIETIIGKNFNKNYRVESGKIIAFSGNFEMGKEGGTKPHVHFEVHDENGKIIDPYADNLWKT
ncbi:MAG: M23 family metallopeptidase [Candidatus Woesebacteria bacterium]|nr:M23 family metallopeptidase [Candidatus Woesebacteria bacterium]